MVHYFPPKWSVPQLPGTNLHGRDLRHLATGIEGVTKSNHACREVFACTWWNLYSITGNEVIGKLDWWDGTQVQQCFVLNVTFHKGVHAMR